MIKTKLERIDVGVPHIAAFRIGGKLGFHENAMVQRLVEECRKREFRGVIFDFTDLSSLGGGVAKILRDFVADLAARGGQTRFVVSNEIVAQFLQDGDRPVLMHRTFSEAFAACTAAAAESVPPAAPQGASASAAPAAEASPDRPVGPAAPAVASGAPATAPPASSLETPAPPVPDGALGNVICMPYDEHDAAGDAPATMAVAAEEVISEIFGSAAAAARRPDPAAPEGAPAPAAGAPREATIVDLNRQLKRRILELKTLFSISSDFNAIRDRKKLVDIFLLTAIAQGGVESAVFLENKGSTFAPLLSKGMEPEAMARLSLPSGAFSISTGDADVIPLDVFPIEASWRAAIGREGVEYVCPFRAKEGLVGLVLLGKRIAGRGMKQQDFEFLRILLNVARGAYDNALMFEREHERTLGIVKTLISIIEENTLLKGTSEIVSRYVGMTAKGMDYPEEHFKDLIYGTVLRDMGMVKVSDLILRSPRDLSKEEWEIIKRHPEDGAEMLARMKFSDHVVNIVRTHHERFNGEGYPYGLRGKEIPLGARIISVVESYAAMIHERPTRPALSDREALDTLKENYGLRYDREVVVQFSRIMEKEIAQSVRNSVPAIT